MLFLTVATLLCATVAFAQSSGNFTYGSNGGGSTHCVLNSNGSITGGQTCSSSCTADASGNITCTGQGTDQCIGSYAVGIKTNSGAGNVFVMRPSAVIGLLTDVSLQKSSTLNVGSSSALAGVDFYVGVSPAPAAVIPNYPVTYASRFVQISSNLFDVLGSTCTTVSATNPTGSCFFNFNESTVSAHSFDWIATGLSSGEYIATVNWYSSLGNTGLSSSMTCVGPVNFTVQQNKVFQFNKVNSF
jgi:hypothetical protein